MLTPYLTPFSHFSYYLIMLVDSSMWSSFTLPMSKRSQNTSIEVLRELSDIVANQERVVTADPILRRAKRRCCAASPRTSRVRRKPLAFPLHYGAYNIVVITIFSQQYTQQKCCQNVSLPKKKKTLSFCSVRCRVCNGCLQVNGTGRSPRKKPQFRSHVSLVGLSCSFHTQAPSSRLDAHY